MWLKIIMTKHYIFEVPMRPLACWMLATYGLWVTLQWTLHHPSYTECRYERGKLYAPSWWKGTMMKKKKSASPFDANLMCCFFSSESERKTLLHPLLNFYYLQFVIKTYNELCPSNKITRNKMQCVVDCVQMIGFFLAILQTKIWSPRLGKLAT